MTEKFEYWQSEKNDEWYFHLVAPNGEIIAQSEGYTSKDGCINGAESVKKYAQTAEILEKEVEEKDDDDESEDDESEEKDNEDKKDDE